jgi:HAMP domain-containing protein
MIVNIENLDGTLKISLDAIEVAPYQIDEESKAVLVGSGEITEERAGELVTVFEAAVNLKFKELTEELKGKYEAKLTEEVGAVRQELTEQISSYLQTVVVEEWFNKNEVALAANAKAENDAKLVESIVHLLKEGFVEVPAERKDLVESLGTELENMKTELGEAANTIKALTDQINGSKCDATFKSASAGLAESDVERFMSLVEDLAIDDPEVFEEKVLTIKKNFFDKKSTKAEPAKEVKEGAEVAPAAPVKDTKDPIKGALRVLGTR